MAGPPFWTTVHPMFRSAVTMCPASRLTYAAVSGASAPIPSQTTAHADGYEKVIERFSSNEEDDAYSTDS